VRRGEKIEVDQKETYKYIRKLQIEKDGGLLKPFSFRDRVYV